jgi:hypothetical protein
MKTQRKRCIAFPFSILGADVVGGQHHAPASVHREGIMASIVSGGLWPKSATEVLATSPCWRGPRCGSRLVTIEPQLKINTRYF